MFDWCSTDVRPMFYLCSVHSQFCIKLLFGCTWDGGVGWIGSECGGSGCHGVGSGGVVQFGEAECGGVNGMSKCGAGWGGWGGDTPTHPSCDTQAPSESASTDIRRMLRFPCNANPKMYCKRQAFLIPDAPKRKRGGS